MSQDVIVEIVEADNWARIRNIRLRALKENPEAFGGTFEKESAEDEAAWREKFIKNEFLVASIAGQDAAMMYIEVLDGDFGATCWIGGCWSDPAYRGKGLFSAMMNLWMSRTVGGKFKDLESGMTITVQSLRMNS
jgi:hypothetical protein